MGLLDFLFPKYCVSCKKIGEYICSNCFSYISFSIPFKCLTCNKGSFNGLTHPGCTGRYAIDGAFSSIAYKGVVKKLLYTFKYKPYLLDLQYVLGDLLCEGLIQNEMFYSIVQSKTILLVPIPLHPKRLRSRGYNQSEVLAKILSKRFAIPVKNVLVRTKKTTAQYGLKREERFKNMEGAFSVMSDKKELIKDVTVLLVDDVLTTGATLLSAANVLKRSGVKRVFGITLAQD